MVKLIGALFLIVTSGYACKQSSSGQSPHGYNFNSPHIIKLPGSLTEISGIAFKNGNPDTLYAHQDEDGKLFYFAPATPKLVQHKKFGKRSDYEDIALFSNRVFMLQSDGVISVFDLSPTGEIDGKEVKETTNLMPAGEYEAMAVDEITGLLHVLCKDCEIDDEDAHTTGYVLQTHAGNGMTLKDTFKISGKQIATFLGKEKLVLRPSALAKNTATNQWFILSAVHRLLVITNTEWQVLEVYPLKKSLFSQPEGIAFDQDHNLYISNEQGNADHATVLKFEFIK